jgi:hypothetical protein
MSAGCLGWWTMRACWFIETTIALCLATAGASLGCGGNTTVDQGPAGGDTDHGQDAAGPHADGMALPDAADGQDDAIAWPDASSLDAREDVADGRVPSGVVGVLGGSCGQPGELACAGNHQKLTLVCGGTGTWAVNQTCGAGYFCETTAGSNAGTCIQEAPECSGQAAGAVLCSGSTIVQCNADNTSAVAVATCSHCQDGKCVDVADPCPVPDAVTSQLGQCASDCPRMNTAAGCSSCVVGPLDCQTSGVFRLPATRDACASQCPSGRRVFELAVTDAGFGVLVRVPAPWHLVGPIDTDGGLPADFCSAAGTSCMRLKSNATPSIPVTTSIVLFADDLSALPRNVSCQAAYTRECP